MYSMLMGQCERPKKSKLLGCFNLQALSEHPQQHTSLVDMFFLWRLATPTSDGRDILHRNGLTWGDYANIR